MKYLQRPIATTFLFTLCFLYIAVVVRPDYLYYALITDGGYVYPPFLLGWDFLFDALCHPGGVVWYLASFLFQTYANPWLGALTVTAAAYCSFALSRATIRAFFGFPLDLFAYAPALTALVTMNRYGDPLPMLVNYDLVLALTLPTIGLTLRRIPRFMAFFPLCFLCAYYFTGGGVVFFSLIVVLFALCNKRRGGVLAAMAAVLLAVTAVLYMYADLRAMLQYGLLTGGYPVRRLLAGKTFAADIPAIIAGSFLLSCALLAPLVRRLHRHKRATAVFGFLSGAGSVAAAIIILAGCLMVTRDAGRRTKITLEYLDRIGAPDAVISFINNLEPARLDPLVLFDLNHALARKGLLGETMFAYPQHPGALALEQPKLKFWVPALIRNAELYYELGYLNLSKASLTELFEGSRIEHPAVIELLGKNALAHGRPAIAKMWYRHLCRDLVYGKKARQVMQYLNDQTPFSGLDTLQLRRKNAAQRDTIITVLDQKIFCAALLRENPQNRMAFDYLVGNYLLCGNLREAIGWLPHCKEAGYDRLPRHWAEALMLYCGLNGIADPGLTDAVPPAVKASFMAFMKACLPIRKRCDRMGMDDAAYAREAASALRDAFGSTYYFYYSFHGSGASRWYR